MDTVEVLSRVLLVDVCWLTALVSVVVVVALPVLLPVLEVVEMYVLDVVGETHTRGATAVIDTSSM